MVDSREEQLEEIEVSDKRAKEFISKANALENLYKNKDFKKVILEGYFEKEASRVVMLRAEPNQLAGHMSDEQNLKMIDDKIVGIGELRQYFKAIFAIANQMRKALEDNEDARNSILEEMNEEDS